MRFFFFGTLMDPELRAVVLGRSLPDDACGPASLSGYIRYHAAGEAFPVLVRRAGGVVDGVLARGLGAEDAARIAWYETDDYEIRETAVRRADGRPMRARCCLPGPGTRHDDVAWDFAVWARRDRAPALVLAREWMALYGTADAAGAERGYQARKRRLLGAAG